MRDRSGRKAAPIRRVLMGIGLAAALALPACSDDSDSGSSQSDSTAPATEADGATSSASSPDTASDDTASDPGTTSQPIPNAAGGEPTPASGDPIVVGTVTDRTVGGGDVTGWVDGIELWVEETNENGGLLGRPVEVRTCYAEGDPAQATACANEMVDDDEVLAFVAGDSVVWPSAVSPVIERAGMLDIHNSTMSLADVQVPNAFLPHVGGYAVFYMLTRYLVEEHGLQNAAVVRFDIGATTEWLELTRSGAEDGGGTFVADIPLAPSTTDYLPAVTQAVSQGAEIITASLGPAGTVALLNAINDGGYTDQVTVVISPSQAAEPAVVEAAGDVEFWSALDNQLLLPDGPGNADFVELAERLDPDRYATDPARLSFGYIAGRTFAALAEQVEGDLTREALLKVSQTASVEVPGFENPLSLENASDQYPGVAVASVSFTNRNEFVESVPVDFG